MAEAQDGREVGRQEASLISSVAPAANTATPVALEVVSPTATLINAIIPVAAVMFVAPRPVEFLTMNQMTAAAAAPPASKPIKLDKHVELRRFGATMSWRRGDLTATFRDSIFRHVLLFGPNNAL
jgi:hypothetical protein